jgi:hypothetical protein
MKSCVHGRVSRITCSSERAEVILLTILIAIVSLVDRHRKEKFPYDPWIRSGVAAHPLLPALALELVDFKKENE